jgi:hypothetical protein
MESIVFGVERSESRLQGASSQYIGKYATVLVRVASVVQEVAVWADEVGRRTLVCRNTRSFRGRNNTVQ